MPHSWHSTSSVQFPEMVAIIQKVVHQFHRSFGTYPDSQVNSISWIGDGSVIKLGSVDLPRLKDLCLACTAFYELVEGRAPTEETAAEILGPLDPEYAHGIKHVWGVEMHGDLVAVAELLQGHPTTYEWYIGLLLVTPQRRRAGLGAQFCRMILDWIALRGGATVRLIVHQQNLAAQSFWQGQGFSTERELEKKSGRLHGQASVFVRSLGRAG
jgi:ribosomal protein S18 acetylase RimI-like enzyme